MWYSIKDYKYELPQKNKYRKLVFWSILIILAITFLLVTAAEAQVKQDVERELEKTGLVIQRAEEAVLESRNPKAENLLKMAQEIQGRAKENFHMLRYRMAVILTLSARKKAYEAIGHTKKDEENENLVLRAIERTDQVINQVEELIRDLDIKRVSSLLDMALRSQQKAKEFFKEHRLRMALKLTLEARETANKARSLAGNGKRVDRLAEKQLEDTERFLDKAWTVVQESQNNTAAGLLEKAKASLEKARDLFNQNAFSRSTKESRKARDLVEKALKLVEEDITPQMVENAIQQNERLIEQGEEAVKDKVNPEATDIFERGMSHQSKATQYYSDGEYKAALAEAKVANRLLNKALQMVEQGGL